MPDKDGKHESESKQPTPGDILTRLDALEGAVAGLVKGVSAKLDAVQAAQSPPVHTHGLCQDPNCDACAGQGRQIAAAAFGQGELSTATRIKDALITLDEVLAATGQQPVGQRVLALIDRGEAIAEQRGLPVAVTQ